MSTNLSPPSVNMRSTAAAYIKTCLLPQRVNLLLIIMKNVIGSLLYIVPPILTKYVLESVLPARSWNLLVIVVICMVMAPITGSMMILLENIWGRFIIRLAGKGRAELYNGIQQQPLDWHRHNRIGDLLTRILDDTRSLTDMVNGHLGFMIFHVVTITAGSAILLILQPNLGFILLVLWVGQAVLMSLLSRHVKKKAAATAQHSSLVSESVRELVSGAAFIKANGREAQAIDNLKQCLSREWDHTRKGVVSDHRVRILNAAMNACFLVLMYTAGGWFVLRGTMTIGSLVAFVAVYNWLRPFGVSLIDMALAVVKVIPSINRVTEIAFPVDPTISGTIPKGQITLETERISFYYNSRPMLQNISFRIFPGSIVSIVGHRGSGKSTLAELLLRLREPTSGSIRLNGYDLSEVDTTWLRQHMLCVTQDVMLRSGTILDNIVYGSEDAKLEDVLQAVRTAELDTWISRLPDGLLTKVGEQALQISGGERQRISIARALLCKPTILILDEATSALDQGTERRLLDHMISQLQGTTLIFITHRLDISLRSDEVLVLNEGCLVQKGSHAELISQPGIYRELWLEQSPAKLGNRSEGDE